MAVADERFEMPDGSVYIVRRPAAETGGESVEMEFVLPSGCVPPRPHIHPQQAEQYEVLEGRFDVVMDGEWRTLAPGESVSVPVGALHTFRNRSGGVVRVRNWRTGSYAQARTTRSLQGASGSGSLCRLLRALLGCFRLPLPERVRQSPSSHSWSAISPQ